MTVRTLEKKPGVIWAGFGGKWFTYDPEQDKVVEWTPPKRKAA